MAREMSDTRVISVMDREADFFDLFVEQRRDPSVELLVRAKHNRRTSKGAHAVRDGARQPRARAPQRG